MKSIHQNSESKSNYLFFKKNFKEIGILKKLISFLAMNFETSDSLNMNMHQTNYITSNEIK